MANNPSDFTIGANDEHGMDPPTQGKRTPVMPYINRSIYENEFNRAAKNRFLEALLRIGFNVYDVKPALQDMPIQTRVARINAQRLTRLVTFGYNAYGSGNVFTNAAGFVTAYSSRNPYASMSKAYCEDIAFSLEQNVGLVLNSLQDLDIGVLGSVNCVSVLVEPGFMTDYKEATLMLDPDFQTAVAEAVAKATCVNLDVPYIERNSLSAYKTLRLGDRGRPVQLLQYLLSDSGFPVDADGIFGPATQRALIDFQRENSLNTDGVAGRNTYRRLLLLDAPETLSIGSRGAHVRHLQQKLLSKLYPLNMDGIFGPATEAALKDSQTAHSLESTGVLNTQTRRTLEDTPPRPRLY